MSSAINGEQTQLARVVGYNQVDWGKIKAVDGHPLDFLLSRGIPVYYKIHRGIFMACKHHFAPLRSNGVRKFSIDEVGLLLEFCGPDEELVCLCLDEEDLREVRATGSRTLIEFSLGGLALRKRQIDSASEPDTMLVEKTFHRCYLVNRQRWKEARPSINRPARLEDYAEPLLVGYEDLHLEVSDVEQLRSARPGQIRELYPLENSVRKLPDAVYWLFQAAIAHNRDKEMEKREIKAWLRANAPNDLFKARWTRTAVNHVPLSYRNTKNSDESVLASFPIGNELKLSFSKHVGLDLLIVLAITEWWMDQRVERASTEWMFALASRLDDFNFAGTELQDLTGMILEGAIDDSDWVAVEERIEQKRRKRQLETAKERARAGVVDVPHIEQPDEDITEQQGNAGDDDQPYVAASLTSII